MAFHCKKYSFLKGYTIYFNQLINFEFPYSSAYLPVVKKRQTLSAFGWNP